MNAAEPSDHQLAEYRPPPDLGLHLLYEDPHVLAVDKPPGLLSVPGRGERMADCLISRVQRRHPEALVVHRLDMDTSGIVLMGRGPEAQRELSHLFMSRQVDKRYEALVHGVLLADHGEIDLPLITDWPRRPRQKVDAQIGKPSLTRFRVIERLDRTTRVALEPVTGRSHQLRVHLMALGHPVVGDDLYGPDGDRAAAGRLMLHACHITLPHPESGVSLSVSCPTPF
jgi:tRNA pseudouridine32 synthase/23S rRNA pseudouridine746 synthase